MFVKFRGHEIYFWWVGGRVGEISQPIFLSDLETVSYLVIYKSASLLGHHGLQRLICRPLRGGLLPMQQIMQIDIWAITPLSFGLQNSRSAHLDLRDEIYLHAQRELSPGASLAQEIAQERATSSRDNRATRTRHCPKLECRRFGSHCLLRF